MGKEITLAAAAFHGKWTYEKARRLLFTGVLEGRQENGKWLVSMESVERALNPVESQLASA